MTKVNLFEAKAKLSEYIDRVMNGEPVLICRHNKPVAELRPVDAARTEERPIGPLPGRPTFDIPSSFFDPIDEAELQAWEGGSLPADQFATGPARGASRVAESPGRTRRTHAPRASQKRS